MRNEEKSIDGSPDVSSPAGFTVDGGAGAGTLAYAPPLETKPVEFHLEDWPYPLSAPLVISSIGLALALAVAERACPFTSIPAPLPLAPPLPPPDVAAAVLRAAILLSRSAILARSTSFSSSCRFSRSLFAFFTVVAAPTPLLAAGCLRCAGAGAVDMSPPAETARAGTPLAPLPMPTLVEGPALALADPDPLPLDIRRPSSTLIPALTSRSRWRTSGELSSIPSGESVSAHSHCSTGGRAPARCAARTECACERRQGEQWGFSPKR